MEFHQGPADRFVVRNARAVDAHGTVEDAWISVSAGRIQAVGRGTPPVDALNDKVRVIDAQGGYVTPGFIDVHFHGGGGHSNENGPSSILAALTAHHRHGTTRAVVSFVTNPMPVLVKNVRAVAELTKTCPLILGSHLEGPFLSVERRGAHSAEHLVTPIPSNIELLLTEARGSLRQITIDPGLPDAIPAITAFVEADVRVAVGHTTADYDTGSRAFAAGASVLTHTFNAMAGIHHREPGPIVAAIDHNAYLELILDGIHVHPRVAAMLFKLAGGRLVLVSDAMAAAGAEDGPYELGDQAVDVRDGTAVLKGTSTLAGSTLTLDRALRLGIMNDIPAETVVEALTLAPARFLGLSDHLGMLEPGYEADLVLFDHDWNVLQTFARGLCVYSGGQNT